MATISTKRLRHLVSYDEATGIFSWRNPNRGARAGDLILGWQMGDYLGAGLDFKRFYLHRLAWQYVTGHPPADQIDHINGDKHDNRFENLREATASTNGANMHGRSSSGFKGVYLEKRSGRWFSAICVRNKRMHLGTFGSPEEAHAAYVAAAAKHFGEFARAK